MHVKIEGLLSLVAEIDAAYGLALAEGPEELVTVLTPIYTKSRVLEVQGCIGEFLP